jgi:uncharacterized protein (TIGR03382 family)
MNMQIAGDDAEQFHFDGLSDPFCGSGQNCASSFKLAPGESRWISVVCEPNRAGVFRSTLTVKSNAADRTIALDCTGAGPASMSTLVFSPSLLDFGTSFAESPLNTVERTLTVTNTATGPSLPVDFEIADVSNGGNGFISPVEHFGSVGPGQSQDFVVVFRWHGGVRLTEPLVLRSADPAQPSISVPMFAEAAYGRLVFDDPPDMHSGIAMPAVAAGETSSLTIQAHNGGGYGMWVDARSFASFGGVSEIQPAESVHLGPGQSAEWTINCTPGGEPPDEGGASGFVNFQYAFAASDLDSFTMFCPILSSPAAAARAQAQLDDMPVGAGDGGGCATSPPTNLVPPGMLLLGLLLRRRISDRRRARPR